MSASASRFASPTLPSVALAGLVGLAGFVGACAPSAKAPTRAPLAEQWFTRAQASYKVGDFEDAREAAKSALQAGCQQPPKNSRNTI